MGKILTKKELAQEQAAHRGQSEYVIYRKTPSGRENVCQFWESSDDDALKRLEIYKRQAMLVGPNDGAEYFYTRRDWCVADRGDGMVEIFDSFDRMIQSDIEKESRWEKFKTRCWLVKERIKDLGWAFADFWYWLKHYNIKTNKSRQRFESWNLDGAVLDMLEFNIPLIMKYKHGVPTEFCMRARAKLHEGEKNFDVKRSYNSNPNSSDEEMKLAGEMWNAELATFLAHIKLYDYYSDGYVAHQPADIDGKYRQTLPVRPGTDGEIDYMKLNEMAQSEWRAIWRWMSQYGQMLWT